MAWPEGRERPRWRKQHLVQRPFGGWWYVVGRRVWKKPVCLERGQKDEVGEGGGAKVGVGLHSRWWGAQSLMALRS